MYSSKYLRYFRDLPDCLSSRSALDSICRTCSYFKSKSFPIFLNVWSSIYRLPILPYLSRRVLRLGRGILEPSTAMICRPHTPMKREWKSRESLLQRKSSTRSKHSLKIEWSMPERALLKACWEHFTVSEMEAPDRCRNSVKNSSS